MSKRPRYVSPWVRIWIRHLITALVETGSTQRVRPGILGSISKLIRSLRRYVESLENRLQKMETLLHRVGQLLIC